MIILCDDGSLKIYVADSDKTDYWLQPHLQATSPLAQLRASPMWTSAHLFQLCPASVFSASTRPTTIDNKHEQGRVIRLKIILEIGS